MPSALITVAAPAQATRPLNRSFALQLRGPFGVDVRTGLSPDPRSLCRLIGAYSPSSQPLASKLLKESLKKKEGVVNRQFKVWQHTFEKSQPFMLPN
jgi:hypothetical protein